MRTEIEHRFDFNFSFSTDDIVIGQITFTKNKDSSSTTKKKNRPHNTDIQFVTKFSFSNLSRVNPLPELVRISAIVTGSSAQLFLYE